MQPEPPTTSPDGRFYLEDGRWKPFPTASTDSRTVARGVAQGISTVIAQLFVAFIAFPIVLFAGVAGVQAVVPDRAVPIATGVVVVSLVVGLFVLIRRWR